MTRNRARLLVALVTATLLVAALPAPTLADAGSASFGDTSVTVTRGETAKITVSHSDTAHVYVGSRQSGFLLEIVLAGSGTDTIELDTYKSTGHPSTFVEGASNVTLHTPQLQDPLVPTRYLMNVTVGGVEQDLGSLTVTPRNEMNGTMYVAPGSVGTTEDGSTSLTVGKALGGATEGSNLTRGDKAVFVFNESGLESAFNPDDLTGDANANGIAVKFTELDPAPNTEPETFYASQRQSVTVLPDFEQGRVVFVWDTSDVRFPPQSNHTWRLDVVLTAENGLVREDTRVATGRVNISKPRVHLTTTRTLRLYPWRDPAVSVNGTTNLVPGSTVNVRARSSEHAFLVQADATVTANRTFSTSLDLSEAPPGATVPLWVLGHRVTTERTVVRYDDRATISFPNQASSGDALTVPRVYLGAGGFVTFRANNTTLGATDHLAPGTHEDLTVPLNESLTEDATVTAVAHIDRDLDGAYNASIDAPYVVGNATVNETASVTLQGSVTATTTTTTTTRQNTTMSSTTTTHMAASGPLVERTPIPAAAAADTGIAAPFPAWTAVVALLGAALLASRTRGEDA